jgi:glutathione S-transferase
VISVRLRILHTGGLFLLHFPAPRTDQIPRWVTAAFWAGIDIDEFPALKAWDDRMLARPGVEKGRHVPDPHRMKELSKDPKEMKEQAEKSRAWVQQGMAADAKK